MAVKETSRQTLHVSSTFTSQLNTPFCQLWLPDSAAPLSPLRRYPDVSDTGLTCLYPSSRQRQAAHFNIRGAGTSWDADTGMTEMRKVRESVDCRQQYHNRLAAVQNQVFYSPFVILCVVKTGA